MSLISTQHRLDRPVGEGDHTQGDPDGGVVLVLYGDYQCPYTARTVPIVQEVLRRMEGDLFYAYRQFPLEDIHPHALIAAEAAESAAAQGKFWEMHEVLFKEWRSLNERHITQYAEKLNLDLDRFRWELDGHAHAAKVRLDKESGERSGVESTPTFYINGFRYDGDNEVAPLMEALEHPNEA